MEEDLFTEIDIADDLPDDVNPLETLVGEGKKFKSTEDLAKAKLEADKFIERLKAENAEFRIKAASANTLESVMSQIKNELSNNRVVEQVDTPLPVTPATIDDPKLKDLITSLMSQSETERKVKSNRDQVISTLTNEFGTEAQTILNKRARELGISVDRLRAVADESPAAFFKLVGIAGTKGAPLSAPQSTINVQSGPQFLGAKPNSFYNKMRDTDPKTYFSKATQKQMHDDAMKLGSSFFEN